jgi:mono/diheme cytochrome c family protein
MPHHNPEEMMKKTMKPFTRSMLAAAALMSAMIHAQANDAAAGKALYQRSCAMCHGPDAVPAGGIPDLRKFRGSDPEFLATVREGRPGTIMPSMKQALSDEEIVKIRDYVRQLRAD